MAIDTERLTFLDGRQLDSLEMTAHEILRLLDVQADAVTDRKIELRDATESADQYEAMLTLTEAYSAGKNAEIRSAWLRSQRDLDPAYMAALSMQRSAENALARTEAARDALSREYQLAVAEIRLAAAQLNFLAE